jgi:hypothetical protein
VFCVGAAQESDAMPATGGFTVIENGASDADVVPSLTVMAILE